MTDTSNDARAPFADASAGIDARELFTPDFTTDPYPTWARVREEAPVCPVRSPRFDSYFVTRFEDAKTALSDERLSKDLYGPRQDYLKFFGPNSALLNQNMLNSDPPEHTRLRRLVTQAFTPRRIEAMRPKVERVVDDLVDALAPTGQAELMADFAFPLPVTVISDLLGVPEEDRASFFEVAHVIRSRGGAGRGSAEDGAAVQDAQQRLADYLAGLIARKREEPQDDLLTALIAARDDESRLSERELVSTAFLLLFAGHQTTSDFLGNAVVALLTHPDQLALLRARPELMPQAVEELLRFDGSVPIASPRIATEDLELGGTVIPAGSIVTVALNAANHDPEQFADPDGLDLERPEGHNLAFGHGIHYCLGIALARLEAQVALTALLTRLPDLTLAVPADRLRRLPGASPFRGLLELPVRFTARAAGD